jgi:peptidoglycan biosynthesis protein MviN/MurJ (putative lipid II flippase)
VILRDPIVTVLFGWNPDTFGPEAVRGCGLALLYYALGLVPIGLTRIWVNLCVAHHDTRTGAQAAIVSLVVNIAGALTLVGPLPAGVLPDDVLAWQHRLVLADFGYLGVVLATTLAAAANAAYVVAVSAVRHGTHVHARDFAGYARLVAASALLCAVLAAGVRVTTAAASLEGVVRLALVIGVAGLVYLAGLWAFGAPEFALVRGMLRRVLRLRPTAG